MADISIAYLEIRLSGGAANTDPDASLGGDMSSERVLSQSSSALSNITGVTIDFAAGNPEGTGTLTYTAVGTTLTWQPNGFEAGTPVDVTGGGRFALFGETGVLLVTVEFTDLPGGNQSDDVDIAYIANEEFDDVSKAESFSGDTEYRCFYLYNAHDTDPFLGVDCFIQTPADPGNLAVGADPSGVGDGTTRSVTTLTRTGSTAHATTGAPHGYATGQTVRIAGAAQAEYNGFQVITVIDADEFEFAVAGTPATPATGTITAARGVPLEIADEETAPTDVTFTEPSSSVDAIVLADESTSLGGLEPGEAVAFWIRRIIPSRNTTSALAAVGKLVFPAFH